MGRGRRGATDEDRGTDGKRAAASLRQDISLQTVLAVVFGGLAVVIGVVSWFVFPHVSYPDRPGPLTVWVDTTRTIDTIELQADGSAAGTTVTVTVAADGDPGDGGEAAPKVSIKTPGEPIELSSCVTPSDCRQSNSFVNWLDAVNQVSGVNEASPEWKRLDGGGVISTMTIHLKGQSIGLYCNEWACRGSVPLLLVDPGVALAESAYGRAFQTYPNMHDYRWQGEGAQTTGLSELVQTTTSLGSTASAEATTWKPLDGENPSATQSASTRSFIAGALIGLAGGALIGSIQCLITRAARQREVRRLAA